MSVTDVVDAFLVHEGLEGASCEDLDALNSALAIISKQLNQRQEYLNVISAAIHFLENESAYAGKVRWQLLEDLRKCWTKQNDTIEGNFP